MPATPADLAVQLPWLAPSVPALAALARGADCDDPAIISDPAAVALVLRFTADKTFPCTLKPIHRAKLLRFAQHRLSQSPCGLVRLNAQPIAEASRESAPANAADRAYIVGLMSQLGRLAIDCIDPNADATTSERSVTSRLARRWRMPEWVQKSLDLLNHQPESIEALGGEIAVIQAVNSAIRESANSLSPCDLSDPYTERLLPDLLASAANECRRDQSLLVCRLESEIERLHAAFGTHAQAENGRLHDRKLDALAELAAGAGHEINTPLAIISGQAQYLLAGEDEPDRRKALQTVVNQAHRVHDMLTELMQFARPSIAEPQVVDLGLLARDVAAEFSTMADRKEVQIDIDVAVGLLGRADPKHVRIALHCLVRNAVEAVPTAGRITLRGAVNDSQCTISVEDSGSGVDPAYIEHMFDPFYSGRSAGRGRGLGLSTAWRLARLQGGEVTYSPPGENPTRFTLTLPQADAQSQSERRSA